MANTHYITESTFHADGTVSVTTVTRATFASGLSYYFERCSKMVVTEIDPRVVIALYDAALNEIEHRDIITQYKPAVTE